MRQSQRVTGTGPTSNIAAELESYRDRTQVERCSARNMHFSCGVVPARFALCNHPVHAASCSQSQSASTSAYIIRG
eukprot:357708-Chlamydomonas_euryale.AAC.5